MLQLTRQEFAGLKPQTEQLHGADLQKITGMSS